jgi:hypothetical protein
MGASWSSTPPEAPQPLEPTRPTVTWKKKPLKIQTKWIKTHSRKRRPVGEVRYVSLPGPVVTLLFKTQGRFYDATGKEVTKTLPQAWKKAYPTWNLPDEMMDANVDTSEWVGVLLQPALPQNQSRKKKTTPLPPLQLIDFILPQTFLEEWDGDGQYTPGMIRTTLVYENQPQNDETEYELYDSFEELTSALDGQETDLLVMESESYDYFHFSCQHQAS